MTAIKKRHQANYPKYFFHYFNFYFKNDILGKSNIKKINFFIKNYNFNQVYYIVLEIIQDAYEKNVAFDFYGYRLNREGSIETFHLFSNRKQATFLH